MTVTLIKQAAAIVGNETKLADACEVSQNAIWQQRGCSIGDAIDEALTCLGPSASWSSSTAPQASQPAKPTIGAGKSEATRAWAPDNWTLDADAFECCCAVCSSQDQ